MVGINVPVNHQEVLGHYYDGRENWKGLVPQDLSMRLQLLGRLESEAKISNKFQAQDGSGAFSPSLSASESSPSPPGFGYSASSYKTETSSIPLTPASESSFDEGTAPHLGHRLSGGIPEEIAVEDNVFSEEIVPRLHQDDISFAEVDIPTPELSLREVRRQIVQQFPFLVNPPEPVAKLRKAGAPPPAMEPLPRVATEEEKLARERSLTVSLESENLKSVIKAQVVLERRKGFWKKISKAEVGQVAEQLPSMPSPWLLTMNTASLLAEGKASNKKTYELPDYRITTSCEKCQGCKKMVCGKCNGIQADECFWCDGSGVRKGKTCDSCKGSHVYQCSGCENQGKVACDECEGEGKVVMGYMIEVKLKAVELPAIPAALLIDPATGRAPSSSPAMMKAAREKVLSTIDRMCASQSQRTSPVIPVMARCLWERSCVRVFSVVRPLNFKWKKSKSNDLDATPEGDKENIPSSAQSSYFPYTDQVEPDSELRYFSIPSAPDAVIKECSSKSRIGSRAASKYSSPVGSRKVTPAASPSGIASLSPKASIANIKAAIGAREKNLRAGSSNTSSSSSSPTSSPPPSVKAKKGIINLFHRRGSSPGSLTSISSVPKWARRTSQQ
ncbi:hypothetical protein IE53DRAFT_362716 [Violaceomyces palustris]|uniref:Uncharacterized protein n=1 Tax=Violaceomyces palustris TaxID=1673888 RepID=A0ACD0NVZ7_9BASI|nr:hypothetical protein IE53DRAFT_362716 [Violaceomyces palustris]